MLPTLLLLLLLLLRQRRRRPLRPRPVLLPMRMAIRRITFLGYASAQVTPFFHLLAASRSDWTSADSSLQQLQWPAFERDVLHAYRRAYRLKTPTSFVSDVHQWVLTQPGSIGLYSPTIARRKEFRRQTSDQLNAAVRKHFNAMGLQENDVIVEFLHKVRKEHMKVRRRRFLYMPRDRDY